MRVRTTVSTTLTATVPPIINQTRELFVAVSGRSAPTSGMSTVAAGSAPARNGVVQTGQVGCSSSTAAPQAVHGQVAGPCAAWRAADTGTAGAGSSRSTAPGTGHVAGAGEVAGASG